MSNNDIDITKQISPKVIATIQQGDQYYLPFIIENDSSSISPEDIDDIRIKVGNVIKKFSSNELLYENDTWLFPITQKNSLNWKGPVKCQIQYKKNNNIITSEEYTIYVKTSMFNDEF